MLWVSVWHYSEKWIVVHGHSFFEYQACPFQGLGAKENKAADDGKQHKFLHPFLVHVVARFHGKHHGNAGKNEDKCHKAHKNKWRFYTFNPGNTLKNFFRAYPAMSGRDPEVSVRYQ